MLYSYDILSQTIIKKSTVKLKQYIIE